MTDSEIKKTEDTEVNKIKAIYPHIVASLVDEKPYYCIRWYDIENKDLNTGYGSFNLEYVCEWYEKYFEEIEYDFLDEINRLQAENERLQKNLEEAHLDIKEQRAGIEVLEEENKLLIARNCELAEKGEKAITTFVKSQKRTKAEACKEFAERVKMEFYYEFDELIPSIMADKIDNLLKEMVGE